MGSSCAASQGGLTCALGWVNLSKAVGSWAGAWTAEGRPCKGPGTGGAAGWECQTRRGVWSPRSLEEAQTPTLGVMDTKSGGCHFNWRMG